MEFLSVLSKSRSKPPERVCRADNNRVPDFLGGVQSFVYRFNGNRLGNWDGNFYPAVRTGARM